jgi:hypothetical protein
MLAEVQGTAGQACDQEKGTSSNPHPIRIARRGLRVGGTAIDFD